MSSKRDKDPTEFFTVVGPTYIRERHDDTRNYYRDDHEGGTGAPGVAVIWIAFYVVVIGASVFTSTGVAKLAEIASLVLK